MGPALSFLLGFVIFRDHSWLGVLDERVAIWLGKISYSFYLIHWPVLWLVGIAAWQIPRAPEAHPVLMSVLVFLISVPLAALIADASFKCIEVPAINLGKRLTGKSSYFASP